MVFAGKLTLVIVHLIHINAWGAFVFFLLRNTSFSFSFFKLILIIKRCKCTLVNFFLFEKNAFINLSQYRIYFNLKL